MRIEKLHFKNLNSLKGEWEIDFTIPEYSQSGPFAITGPTGAGKSTILDAISLALYGKTPRLGSVSTKENDVLKNEILNKESLSCFSEVTFTVKGNTYRAFWQQRRAQSKRQKANNEVGNFQPVDCKLEICEGKTWRGLAESIKKKNDLIVEITGLDFPQFSRSVLLAQGKFAEFLQGDPKDRAKALEQITGTEEYTKISMRIHEKAKQLEQALNVRLAALGTYSVMSDEDRQAKEDELRKNKEQSERFASESKEINEAISWLNDVETLKHQKDDSKKRLEALETRKEEFTQKKQALDRSKSANSIRELFVSLNGLSTSIKTAAEAEMQHQNSIKAKEQEKTKLEDEKKDLESRLEKHSAAERELNDVIRNVRVLDERIITLRGEEKQQQEKISINNKKLDTVRAEWQEIKEKIDENQEDISNKEAWLKAHVGEKALFDDKQTIFSESVKWEGLRTNFDDALREEEKIKSQIKEFQKSLDELVPKIQTGKEKIKPYEDEIKQLEQRVTDLLQGKSLTDLSTASQKLGETKNSLVDVERQLKDSLSTGDLIAQKNLEKTDNEKELAALKQSKVKSEELIKSYEQRDQELEKAMLVASFEEQRLTLQENDPCPLCGSKDHPYCVDLPEEKESLAEKRKSNKKQLAKERDTLDNIVKNIAGKETAINSVERDVSQLKEKLTEQHNLCKKTLALLNIAWSDDITGLRDQIIRKIGNFEAEKANLDGKISDILKLTTDKDKLTADKSKLSEDNDRLDRNYFEITTKKESARNNLENAGKSLELKKLEIESKISGISRRWGNFVSSPLTIDSISSFFESILDKAEEYSKNLDACNSRKTQGEQLTAQLKGKQVEIDNLKNISNDFGKSLSEKEEERKAKETRRKELFQDKDCAVEEKLMAEKTKQLNSSREDQDRQINAVVSEISRLSGSLKQIQSAKQANEKERSQKQGLFAEKLTGFGFADQEEWQNHLLDEVKVEEQAREIRDHETQILVAETQLKQSRKSLEEKDKLLQADEKLKTLAEKPLEQLRAELTEIQRKKETSDISYGALEKELIQDKEQRKSISEITKEVDARRKELERWKTLDSMIGSFDGSKYRAFVQSLAFESLIRKADEELKKLSSRYVLVARKGSDKLELDVIDNDMGGEIRPIENLSGGETFIMSLALALGLSQMASNNVQIDSLFLDEGFGSLDEDNLDKALRALGKINAAGKTIGIISHVAKIQRDIPYRIEVIPSIGGSSKLEGPGVSFVESSVP